MFKRTFITFAISGLTFELSKLSIPAIPHINLTLMLNLFN